MSTIKTLALILPGQYFRPFTLPAKTAIIINPCSKNARKVITMHKSKAVMLLRAHMEYIKFLQESGVTVKEIINGSIKDLPTLINKIKKDDVTIHAYAPPIPIESLQVCMRLGCVFHEDPSFMLTVARIRDIGMIYPPGKHCAFAEFAPMITRELKWPIVSNVTSPLKPTELELMPYDPPTHMVTIGNAKRLPRCEFGRFAFYPATPDEAEAWLADFIQYRLLDVPTYNHVSLTRSVYVCNTVLDAALNMGIITAQRIADAIMATRTPSMAKSIVLTSLLRREYRRFIGCVIGNNVVNDVIVCGKANILTRTMNSRWYTGSLGINPVDFLIKKSDQYAYLHDADIAILTSFMRRCCITITSAIVWFDRQLIYCIQQFSSIPSYMARALAYEMATNETLDGHGVLSISNFMPTNGPNGADWTKLWDALDKNGAVAKKYLKTIDDTTVKLVSYVKKPK